MRKPDCDIVKDLIPSYVDDICSESSRKAVEEHMAECEECRRFVKILRQTEIISEETDLKELDYMEKVKRHYTRKNVVAAGLCVVFGAFFLGVCISVQLYNMFPEELYYILFPVLTLGISFLLSDYQKKPEMNWQRILPGVLSAIGFIHCLGLNMIVFRMGKWMVMPFGMDMIKTGPFLNRQYVTIIVVEFILFTWYVADSIRKEHAVGIWPAVNLAGSFLAMISRDVLYHMAAAEAVVAVEIRITVIILAELIGIVLLEWYGWKMKSNQ